MAHLHLRKDKICLNCGTTVEDRYCPHCGQENTEPKENIGHLFMHFFEDLTHFDGKFFQTMKPLLFKPGFLPEEYTKGRRASYLNPIRMYLFISAIFFFVLMTFFLQDTEWVSNTSKLKGSSNTTPSSSVSKPVSKHQPRKTYSYSMGADTVLSLHKYDSNQHALPANKRDGFIKHYFYRRFCATVEYVNAHPDTYTDKINEKISHSFPQMFFIALPAFALFLSVLYIRRKQYNYVSHAIFSIHFYCVTFIALFLVMLADKINAAGYYIELAILLLLWIYLFTAMKRFYKQGAFKTFIKFLLLNLSTMIFVIILLMGYVVNSFLSLANA